MAITRNFKLFLNAGSQIPLLIHANQYDSGEQWRFTLYNQDGSVYEPSSGAIVGIKSDGHGIINTGTVSGGKVVITETQQMTAAAGKAVFELMIDGGSHGTANFIVLVEPKPGDQADLSESDLSLIQEAINSTTPANIASAVSTWMSDNLTPTTPVVDASLSLAGAAADAKKTGDEITALKSAISQSTGMSAEFKVALENLVNQLAFKGDDPTGRTYIDALHTAMYPPANLSSISAVYTQSSTVHSDDNLDVLRDDLVVTAHYDNDTSEIVTSYTLSGTLEVGTSTITVSYGGKTATFDVSVSLPSGYLYVLQSPFESTGNNRIDTGVMYAKNSVYTILTEFVKSMNSSTVKFVYSNKKAGNTTNYIGLQTQNAVLWGMGISYSNGANLGRPEATIRTAVVVTIGSDGKPSASIKYKDVTNNANRNYSTTYTGDITDSANSNSIVLGDAEEAGTGFTGTINDFQLIDHELTSTEISAYLANGAIA